MADATETDLGTLSLLLRLSQIQATLKPLHKRMTNLISERATVLQKLRDLGVTPKDIQRLTEVPLSTIYANTTRHRDGEGGREGDG